MTEGRQTTGRRKIAIAMLAVAGLGLGIPAAAIHYRQSIGPLDLSEAQRGSVVVVDRDGKLLRAFTTQDGRWRLPVLAKDVDPRFLSMLLAFEDRRFETHHGVDYKALGRAAVQWMTTGHIVSGGSTLTMQVARLLARTQSTAVELPRDDDASPKPRDREERSLAVKLRQIVRALEIERHATKTQVLDVYLALAPYGGNLEGIRAASLAYFGKEPKRLSVAEAALLVALPQSPETRRPDHFGEAARIARDKVLVRAAEAGVITNAEQEMASAEPVPQQRRAFPAFAPHASEEALRGDPTSRVIKLTLDAKLQASLEGLAHDGAARLGPKLSAAILVVDNATGAVLAHVGAADYLSQDRAGAIDMTQAMRSPGSALKPFIYALAFENGIAHPETILDDRPSRYGLYAPQNFDLSYQGTVTARRALQLSLNVPAIELLSEVGAPQFLARLRNAGATIALSPDAAPGLAVGLGGLGITLSDLARLYAGLARGGSVPDLIEKSDQIKGQDLEDHRIAEPVAAWYVADILRGAPPPLNAPAGRIAYKTGTSYGFRDAFAVGFDKAYTIAVWIGRPDNAAVPGLVGRQVAAPILFDAFARLGDDYEFLAAPRNALITTTSLLPPPLRHLRKDAPKTFAAAAMAPLKIAYPPDGARVDLGLTKGDTSTALALKAQGGVPPLTWIVNGTPLGAADLRRQSAWTPDGAGFARVSVIDAKGASDSVLVRLE
ncbi:penicillin-binding protein 1C [Methyloferula stellata]|uniref:penicillin-binding protein 1C n=1 Tax=Methyloferula stellata TaxID=876270 RepID=UPI0003613980